MLSKTLLLLGLSSCACMPRPPEGAPDVRPSVDLLHISTQEGGGTCSAWVIADETVASAKHCLVDGASFIYGILEAVPLPGQEDGPDLALWHVEGLHAAPLRLADHDPCFGCTVVTTGFPGGTLMANQGLWSGRTETRGMGKLSTVAWFGQSGSAVLDRDGRVVCELVSIRTDYSNLALCVPWDQMRSYVTEHGIR